MTKIGDAKLHYDGVGGCIIDGSHDSADGFAVDIILEAITCGWGDQDAAALADRFANRSDPGISSQFDWADDSERAYEASEDAVMWLNDHIASGDRVFWVEESCLFYGEPETD